MNLKSEAWCDCVIAPKCIVPNGMFGHVNKIILHLFPL